MSEHDPHAGEKELVEKLEKYQLEQKIERATATIVSEIGHMNEDHRKEVLTEALKRMGSSLEVRKSGKPRK